MRIKRTMSSAEKPASPMDIEESDSPSPSPSHADGRQQQDQEMGMDEDEDDLDVVLQRIREALPKGEAAVLKLRSNFNPNVVDKHGVSLLMRACMLIYVDVVLFLLQSGVDAYYRAPKTKMDDDGSTALHVCARTGDFDSFVMISMQGGLGSKGEGKEQVGEGKEQRKPGDNPLVTAPTVEGLTPLMIAACNGHQELVDYMLGLSDYDHKAKANGQALLGTSYCMRGDYDACLHQWKAYLRRRERTEPRPTPDEMKGNMSEDALSLPRLQVSIYAINAEGVRNLSVMFRENILGKSNAYTLKLIGRLAINCLNGNNINRYLHLMTKYLKNLSTAGCAFSGDGEDSGQISETVDAYVDVLVAVSKFQIYITESDQQFGKLVRLLNVAVGDILTRSETKPLQRRSRMFQRNRHMFVKISLHLVALMLQSPFSSQPQYEYCILNDVKAIVESKYRDWNGDTLLHMACKEDTNVFQISALANAKIERFPAPLLVIELLCAAGCDVNAVNWNGLTACDELRKQNSIHVDVVKFLEKAAAPVETKTTEGTTTTEGTGATTKEPQMSADGTRSTTEATTMMSSEETRAAPTGVRWKTPEQTTMTTPEVTRPAMAPIGPPYSSSKLQNDLIMACLQTDSMKARHLVTVEHADLDKPGTLVRSKFSRKVRFTPLLASLFANDIGMTNYFLEKGASLNTFKVAGVSPLELAVCHCNPMLVHLLLSYGADPNGPTALCSPLIEACRFKDVGIAAMLLENGADPDVSYLTDNYDDLGMTALHAAAAWSGIEMVQLLLEYGARFQVRPDGANPLLTAALMGNADVVVYLVGQPGMFSREQRADAMELLGTAHHMDGDDDDCLESWRKAVRIRNEAGLPPVPKKIPLHQTKRFDTREIQTLDAIEDLEDGDAEDISIQCKLMAERILEPENAYVTKIMLHDMTRYLEIEDSQTPFTLTMHCLDKLTKMNPFLDPARALVIFIKNVFPVIKAEGGGELSHVKRAFRRAVSLFDLGDSAKPKLQTTSSALLREDLLKVIIHLMCFMLPKLCVPNPGRKVERGWDMIVDFLKKDVRGYAGETALHYVCSQDTENFYCAPNKSPTEAKKTLARFPTEPVVVLMLIKAGCDVNALDKNKRTPYDVAKEFPADNKEILWILEQAGGTSGASVEDPVMQIDR